MSDRFQSALTQWLPTHLRTTHRRFLDSLLVLVRSKCQDHKENVGRVLNAMLLSREETEAQLRGTSYNTLGQVMPLLEQEPGALVPATASEQEVLWRRVRGTAISTSPIRNSTQLSVVMEASEMAKATCTKTIPMGSGFTDIEIRESVLEDPARHAFALQLYKVAQEHADRDYLMLAKPFSDFLLSAARDLGSAIFQQQLPAMEQLVTRKLKSTSETLSALEARRVQTVDSHNRRNLTRILEGANLSQEARRAIETLVDQHWSASRDTLQASVEGAMRLLLRATSSTYASQHDYNQIPSLPATASKDTESLLQSVRTLQRAKLQGGVSQSALPHADAVVEFLQQRDARPSVDRDRRVTFQEENRALTAVSGSTEFRTWARERQKRIDQEIATIRREKLDAFYQAELEINESIRDAERNIASNANRLQQRAFEYLGQLQEHHTQTTASHLTQMTTLLGELTRLGPDSEAAARSIVQHVHAWCSGRALELSKQHTEMLRALADFVV